MMKHSFLSKLFVPACALVLSSCYTNIYGYVWHRAEVIDEAHWVEDPEKLEVYRVGEDCYVKGFVGPARGGMDGDFPGGFCFLRGGAEKMYHPIKEKGRPAYILLDFSASQLEKLDREAKAEGYKNDVDDFFSEGRKPYLTELPPGAVRMNLKNSHIEHPSIYHSARNETRRDAHQYYAYPLGALIWLGVDAPLTLTGNAILASTYVAMLPIGGVVKLGQVCAEWAQTEPVEVTPSPAEKKAP